MRSFLVVIVSLSCALVTNASEYERRLIPITVTETPGAFGTRWTTRVSAVQELQTGVEIVGDLNDLPGSVGGSQPYRILPLPSQDEPPGSIVHVPKDAAQAVHIGARLLQRGAIASEETVLPVVAEHDFVSRTRYFEQLSNDPAERVHLRAYSLDLQHPDPAVRVRVQATWVGATAGWSFIYDAVHPLTVLQKQTTSLEGETFALRPLALELSLDAILDTVPEHADIAISVMPASEGLRIWAMVSETNNVTQRVRISLP